jgi:hypothetical protein
MTTALNATSGKKSNNSTPPSLCSRWAAAATLELKLVELGREQTEEPVCADPL